MTKCEAAKLLFPNYDWVQRGDLLEQALDDKPRIPVPSDSALQLVMDAHNYGEFRRQAYPLLSDQLDAIWKGGPDMDAMRNQIMAIKAKYPKGQI